MEWWTELFPEHGGDNRSTDLRALEFEANRSLMMRCNGWRYGGNQDGNSDGEQCERSSKH
jgi:hypothetical protein